MLSIFPDLLNWSIIAPFILRLALGITLIHFAWVYIKSSDKSVKTLGLIEGVLGLLILIGLFTQLATLIVSIILIGLIFGKIKEKAFLTNGINYYLLLLAMAISLIFLGAGYPAFDLPL